MNCVYNVIHTKSLVNKILQLLSVGVIALEVFLL